MKNLILILLMFFTKLLLAQNSITVSGVFKENYRSLKLSREVKRLLFIKKKGHFKLPEYNAGYFLNLTKEDAVKTGFQDIVVIPLTADIYKSDKKVTLELIQLSKDEPSVFYTKRNDIDKGISYSKKIFDKPTLKDTVDWSELNLSDFHYTKEWIDNLDNEKEVTLRSYIIYHTDNGGGSSVRYEKIKMKELAEQRLHYVANLFNEDRDEWTKKQWQDWFSNTINYQEPILKDCNPNTYSISNIYKYDDGYTMLFGMDNSANKIFGMQMLSYNVDQFKDRQIVVIDSLKYYKYDFYTELQKQVVNIRAFESLNNSLYVFDYYANWSRFEYDKDKDQYIFKEKKEIALPESAGKRSDSYVNHLQSNNNLIYAITKNEKTKEFYAIVLKTQTGETVKIKSLKDVLANTAIDFTKEIEVVYLKYGLKTSADFAFGIKQGEDYYLVKTDMDLQNVKLIKTINSLRSATLFVNEKTIDVLKSDNGNLEKLSFDKELTKLLSSQYKKIENWYYDEDGVVVYDGLNYKLFAPYQLPQYYGINLLTLNDKLETIKKQCVYQFLPLEEPEDANMIHLKYATKLNNDWWLLFKHESSLRYAKVK